MKVKLCATQFACSNDYDKTIKKAIEIVRKAKKEGADVILLQELFQRQYFCQIEDYDRFNFAEEYDRSKTLNTFSNLAKELEVVLPISFFEKEKNSYYNSICIIDNDGSKLGLYRKSHIPTGQCYEEKFYFTPGDTGFKVFNTHKGNLGIGICWDQWFLETGRILALKGAQYLMFPTAIGSEPTLPIDSSKHWQNAMAGQAALNIMPLVASNRIGTENDVNSSMTFYGSSFIADECGNIVEKASKDKEEILVHEFDLEKIDNYRRDWGIFRDRRIDLYSPILTHNGEDK